MKQLRALVLVLAVVVSGLALVTVAPAPPAAAIITRTFTQGSLQHRRGHVALLVPSGSGPAQS